MTIMCGVKIGGADYDHRLTEKAKGELISLLTAIPNHGSETNSPLSGVKGKRLLSISQDNTGEMFSDRSAVTEEYKHRELARKKSKT